MLHLLQLIILNFHYSTSVSPANARIFVLDKIGFSRNKTMEVKRVYLKTEHGYSFAAKLYNSDTYTHFECKQWRALCKAYAFEPDMLITFDIRPGR